MRLTERYRPESLSDLVGQPCVSLLRAFAAAPYQTCWLFESPGGGTGKTSAALALCRDLDSEESTTMLPCSELNTDRCRELVRSLALKPMFGGGKWNVLLLEELETLHPQCQTFLKVALENLPRHALVIATSNSSERLQPALVQRFNRLLFQDGKQFADSYRVQIASIWSREAPQDPMPAGWQQWGMDAAGRFSARVALDNLELALLGRKVVMV